MCLLRSVLALICGLGTTLGFVSAADDSLAATLARMDQAGATFRGFSADLQKVSHTAVINEDTADTGTILVRRPKPHDVRARLDFKPPNPKQVAFAGHTVQVYYPNSNAVEEYDLSKNKGVVDQFLLLGFGSNSKDLETVYSIKLGGPETAAGQKTMRIELIPKSPDLLANLKRADLWISGETGIAVQQKFYLPGGDYSVAIYTNIKINPTIPDSALRLDVPKDARRKRPPK